MSGWSVFYQVFFALNAGLLVQKLAGDGGIQAAAAAWFLISALRDMGERPS